MAEPKEYHLTLTETVHFRYTVMASNPVEAEDMVYRMHNSRITDTTVAHIEPEVGEANTCHLCNRMVHSDGTCYDCMVIGLDEPAY